jgi:DNA phosphorothioation-dependent restriction protein DptG
MAARRWFVVVSLGALLAVAGCGKEQNEPASPAPTEQEVKGKINDAAESAARYLADQKDRFIEESQHQLDQLQGQIDQLKAQAEAQGQAAWDSYQEMKPQLDEKVDAAKKELANARTETTETWQDVKDRVNATIADLRGEYDKVKARVTEPSQSDEGSTSSQ